MGIIIIRTGKVAKDNCTLLDLNLKPNLKIMMMGSLEEAIEGARTKPDVGDEVINDLDIEEEEVDVENQEVCKLSSNNFKKLYLFSKALKSIDIV